MAAPVEHGDRVNSRQSSSLNETTPLLPTTSAAQSLSEDNQRSSGTLSTRAASDLRQSISGQSLRKGRSCRRWPSILALFSLCLVAVFILFLGFGAPQIVNEYAQQALVIKPVSLSIGAATDNGVWAKISADLTMDASRVQRKSIRDLGRFGTWIARKVESKETLLTVRLPEYSNMVVGTAVAPAVVLDIRNGHTTSLTFDSHLTLVEAEPIRAAARQWLNGELENIVFNAEAHVELKSGLLPLGRQQIAQSLSFESAEMPFGNFSINHFGIKETGGTGKKSSLAATASITLNADFPFAAMIPAVALSIYVNGCVGDDDDSSILLAESTTPALHVTPEENLVVNVTAYVRRLSEALLQPCPQSQRSPLDTLLKSYIQGEDTTVFVRASETPAPNTPAWLTKLITDFTIAVPFPGHSLGDLIKNFSMTDVQFSLPSFFAEPGSSDAQPRISANVKALVAVPREMDFQIDVSRIRATADVFYESKKLGELDLRQWRQAKSHNIKEVDEEGTALEIESSVKNAPLNITDDVVFTNVIKALLTSDKSMELSVDADVDVELETTLGTFVIREIPASGAVPVKPVSDGKRGGLHNVTELEPTIGGLRILDTNATSVTLAALVNITNPTEYSAKVPYFDIDIAYNGTDLGHATVKDVHVKEGRNFNIPITAVWNPTAMSGTHGRKIGRELLSQYVSGLNTTITIKTHAGTIPAQPLLGKALSSLPFDMPAPKLGNPPGQGDDDSNGDSSDDDGRPHFVKGATMHLFTSSATFIVDSPLEHSTLYITYINATAFYEGDAVGRVVYEGSIEVPPGSSETPRLPVEWSPDSVGFDAIRRALGGKLKLSAEAVVGIRIGRFTERIWYSGGGIGAKIRP